VISTIVSKEYFAGTDMMLFLILWAR